MDPERRLAHIYRADGSESVIDDAEMLDGEDLVPGFGCRLGTVLYTAATDDAKALSTRIPPSPLSPLPGEGRCAGKGGEGQRSGCRQRRSRNRA